jgi:hypothetical protein
MSLPPSANYLPRVVLTLKWTTLKVHNRLTGMSKNLEVLRPLLSRQQEARAEGGFIVRGISGVNLTFPARKLEIRSETRD